jgi:hypothetical protein
MRENVLLYTQSAVIVLVGIQIRLYALIVESEHVYVRDMTWSGIRHSIRYR